MTYIEQRAITYFTFGSRFYGQDLDHVKTEDCITVWFNEAVFPQSIAVYRTDGFGDGVVIRVWSQTWDNEWFLLWEAHSDEGMRTSKKFSPPIRQIKKLMRVFRLDFNYSLIQYRSSFDAVVLAGYKPKFLNQENRKDYLYRYIIPLPGPTLGGYLIRFRQVSSKCNPNEDFLVSGIKRYWSRRQIIYYINNIARRYDFVSWYLNEFWLARSLHSYNDEHELLRLSLPKIRKPQHHCNKDSKPFPTLPAEVMLQIFNYLDIKSLHRCAQVNKKWLLLSQDASLYYELNLKKYWHKVNNRILKHFIQICKHLKKLDLSWCGRDGLITEEVFIEFLQTCCQNLTHLSLGHCSFVKSSTLEEIGKCNNLTDLRLTWCEAEYYFPLTQLKRLTILVLDRSSIVDEELIAILSVNPNLEHLILDYCDDLKRLDNVTETIAVYNSKLITWSSCFCSDYSLSYVGIGHLAKCPDLRDLNVSWCDFSDGPDDCLERIAHGCKNLKRLVLAGIYFVSQLTEHHLLPIIRSCDKLIWLDIGSVESISKDFCETTLALLPDLKLLELCFGVFEEEQIAAWKKQYPNVVIQCQKELYQYAIGHVLRWKGPNYGKNHTNIPDLTRFV